MNKEEALKCINISKKKHKEGDTKGALKFAQKGVRLCECIETKSWLSFVEANPTATSSKTENESVRKRNSSAAKETESTRSYTPEQVQGIKRILEYQKKGDLYGIFGLEKGCSDAEIKKAYRKHALIYHPDKCDAPKADEAFKAIGHAWAVLGDEDKRANFDRFGIDSERSSRSAPGRHPFGFQQGHGGFPEGEISPEDLLRMFMGGQFGGQTFSFNMGGPQFHRAGRGPQRQRNEDNSASGAFLQLLPVILLFLMTAFTMFGGEDAPFSFQQTGEYSLEKQTYPHGVTYYVNPKVFSKKYSTNRKKKTLNDAVENDYLQHIRYRCSQEKETKNHYIRQASSFFSTDEEKLRKAKAMPMPMCDKLADWYNS